MSDKYLARGSFAVTIQATLYYNDIRQDGPNEPDAQDNLIGWVERAAKATHLRGAHEDSSDIEVVEVRCVEAGDPEVADQIIVEAI